MILYDTADAKACVPTEASQALVSWVCIYGSLHCSRKEIMLGDG